MPLGIRAGSIVPLGPLLQYATIRIHWNEARGELAIGNRQGRSPGMLEDREFHVV